MSAGAALDDAGDPLLPPPHAAAVVADTNAIAHRRF
jgi:hypothetical protein